MPNPSRVGNRTGVQANPTSAEKPQDLLSTKLYLPPVRQNLVRRPHLVSQLNTGLDKKVILISAPAGYGKTTLVCSWLHETRLPVAWISLDENDNDALRFLQYLLVSLHRVIQEIQPEMLSAVRSQTSFEPLLVSLIQEISHQAGPILIGLDDFHVIQAQPILDFMADLISHAPSNLHVVLLSRTDPFLPLPLLRARNELMEIRADQLRFTQGEIAAFLSQGMSIELTTTDVQALQARTEGWIAGIQLAALSLQQCEDVHAFIAAFAGSHHYIIDYLTEEVLKRQPEQVRNFLLQTSILSRMCGQLCDAVVEPDARIPDNGQAMLEELERKNLFLIPLDGERRWYRYHHLFADMLIRRLDSQNPELSSHLHRRASAWYEEHGYIQEAIEHSMAAGASERAIRLIEQNGVFLLVSGEVTTLMKWISDARLHSQPRPWLYIFRAWVYALSGELEQAESLLKTAEDLISSQPPAQHTRMMQGTIAAARAHCSNLQGAPVTAAGHARQALSLLTGRDPVSLSLRAVATSLLGDATSLTGDLEEARRAYLESAHICQAAGDVHLIIVVNSNLANILVEQGMLHQAEKIYSDTLSMATRPDGQKALISGRSLVELSQVYYEWNRLNEAYQYAQNSLTMCRLWGNIELQAVAHAQLSRLEFLNFHPEQAQSSARAAEQLVHGYDLATRYSTWVNCVLANLATRQGDFEHAKALIQSSGLDPSIISSAGEIPYMLERIALAFARVLLAQGDVTQSLPVSQRVLQQAEAGHLTPRVIEALIIEALAYQAKKDVDRAQEFLGRALQLAQPENYVRLFLDEGEPMRKLLYQAKVSRMGGSFVSELLEASVSGSGQVMQDSQVLVEALTRREIEVLQLIEDGCTNQDIANRLVISIPTVKRHISNIYSKLGAKNRAQAIMLGKELNLLD